MVFLVKHLDVGRFLAIGRSGVTKNTFDYNEVGNFAFENHSIVARLN